MLDVLRTPLTAKSSASVDLVIVLLEIEDRIHDSTWSKCTDSKMGVFISEPCAHCTRVRTTNRDERVGCSRTEVSISFHLNDDIRKISETLVDCEVEQVFSAVGSSWETKRLRDTVETMLDTNNHTAELLAKLNQPARTVTQAVFLSFTTDKNEHRTVGGVEHAVEDCDALAPLTSIRRVEVVQLLSEEIMGLLNYDISNMSCEWHARGITGWGKGSGFCKRLLSTASLILTVTIVFRTSVLSRRSVHHDRQEEDNKQQTSNSHWQ